MKRFFLVLSALLCFLSLFSTGFILNSGTQDLELMTLTASDYHVDIENQIAQVKSTETFINENFSPIEPRLYFPIPNNASATKIRWYIDSEWFEAVISPNPQNPIGGPATLPDDIISYLENTYPVIFDIPNTISELDTLIVEVNYVQLLSYSNGNVDLYLKNNYVLINPGSEILRNLTIYLNSDRTITAYDLYDSADEINTLTPNNATTTYLEQFFPEDYHLQYTLSQENLGLWAMSNYLDTVPDNGPHGFFTMIVEPDPSTNTDVINKVFTLIIDRSGSMYGNKIIQAKNAASYIVNNLNEGDQFNLVTFSSDVTSLWNSHFPYNEENKEIALDFINQIQADAATYISGAFQVAVPQFTAADSSTANIIIFFTDGEQTAGITYTPDLITFINNLIINTGTNINLFNFGIGPSVNNQLLTTTANDNNGAAVYLGNDELYSVLTNFYMMIRNPVLLHPTVTINPADVITDIHPISLPNLYKGNQMIVSGRYSEPVTVNLTFSGMAYQQPVSYQYTIALSDSNQTKYAFLSKLWAKQKIDDLMIQYYTYPPNSYGAYQMQQQIIDLSVMWGVLSPFTSFTGGEVSIEDETPAENESTPSLIKIRGNYPNPFNPNTFIKFAVTKDINEMAEVKIYNLKGQLVKTLYVKIQGAGEYSVEWNGKNELNKTVGSGIYLYKISCGHQQANGKMMLIK